jgi:sulfide dehydrogenase [flavocytochrome c] flavoprotein chain
MRRRTFLQLGTVVAAGGMFHRRSTADAGIQLKAKVLVVGGGFAGATCAISLRHLNPSLDVTLVDPDNRYVTCPMSNSVLVGLRDMRSISVSREGVERSGVRYVRDRISTIDTGRRRARLGGGATLAYDRLVMAPGIRFLWGQPQGYDESAAQVMPHAWQAGPQTEILARQLREIRSGGVVAISVPPGLMRCPPGPFERASLIAGFLKQNKPRCKVLIFDANNRFPKQDVFTDAWAALYPGMIEWIPVVEDGAVVRVSPEKMTLFTSHRTQRVDVANIIPPQAPALLAAQTDLASDHGWCPIKPETFESGLIANVHVIGDACIAGPMPKAASAAHTQAKQCALAIIAALDGREPPAPLLESVCYSMLAPGKALSIRGRFRVSGGEGQGESSIEQMPGLESQSAVSSSQEAQNAEGWYQSIVAESFGT